MSETSAINLKLSVLKAWIIPCCFCRLAVLASSVCPHNKEHGSKKAQPCDSGENIEDWRLESVTWYMLD
jgi:hypothetical protein